MRANKGETLNIMKKNVIVRYFLLASAARMYRNSMMTWM